MVDYKIIDEEDNELGSVDEVEAYIKSKTPETKSYYKKREDYLVWDYLL